MLYGPKYTEGDTVRLWTIEGRPIGTVEAVLEVEGQLPMFRIRYTFPGNGFQYVNDFAGDDLTLVDRFRSWDCNCKTVGDRHTTWCNNFYKKRYSGWT